MISYTLNRNASDRSILSSFSVNGEEERRKQTRERTNKRSVSFDESSNIIHEFERVSTDDHDMLWNTKSDYDDAMRNIAICLKMKKQGYFQESKEQTFLGLEHYRKSKKLEKRRQLVLASVLQEQYMQMGSGIYCPERIAEAYRNSLSGKVQHIEISF